jgi:hypothetical protein
MDSCYLCGKEFDSKNTLRHDEHIIQQAIGGVITDKNILCLGCGEKLGKEVDVPFNAIFHGISTRLDIKKDRKVNKKAAVKGTVVSDVDGFGIDLSGTEVIWKDFKVTPTVPLHRYVSDNSKVIIYAQKKQARNYIKKVESEIKTKFPDNEPEIVLCDDIHGVVSYPFEMDNNAFKKGLAKIAIGYAYRIGIPREELPLVLSVGADGYSEIRTDIKIIPYLPLSALDSSLESLKSKVGYFPTHTLIIFTAASDPSLLVCYIELFSTFQYYVILNDNYKGIHLYEYHYQRLLKVDDYIFEPGRRYHKERRDILAFLKISENRIQEAFEKQQDNEGAKSMEEIEIDIVREEHIKQKYRAEFQSEIDRGLSAVTQKIFLGGLEKVDNPIDIKMNVDLFYKRHGDDEIFNISSYRRVYTHNNSNHDYVLSLISSSRLPGHSEKFRQYGHYKFAMLNDFIEQEGFKRKFN